jgi:HPr kinase/phosphorylase
VDFDGKSILAVGPSGAGKSSLALNLIALGGVLVSDDQLVLSTDISGVTVSPPDTLAGKIEARYIGILNCPHVRFSRLNLVVDLSVKPQDRLPHQHSIKIGAHHVEIIAGKSVENLPIAAKLLNLYGRDQAAGIKT